MESKETVEYIIQFVLENPQFWRCYSLPGKAAVKSNVSVDDPFLNRRMDHVFKWMFSDSYFLYMVS